MQIYNALQTRVTLSQCHSNFTEVCVKAVTRDCVFTEDKVFGAEQMFIEAIKTQT